MIRARPLRSVLIGDVDFYASEFAFGVNQALTRAGHFHTTINIRQDIGTIQKRVSEMHPDVIWGHMLLWAPGENKTVDLLCLCEYWRKQGAVVLIHDGDARSDTRFPTDISPAVDLALCNHTTDRSPWKIPQLHWPYFAFDQEKLATQVPEFTCSLAFAGRLDTGPLYGARTQLVMGLKAVLGEKMKIFPNDSISHSLFRTPELAMSATAVLGFGRPERNGWLDVRVFQYPGAGGVLLHDDVGGMLEPWRHYVKYQSGSVGSILEELDKICHTVNIDDLRLRAFNYVQEKHSATARVRDALRVVGLIL